MFDWQKGLALAYLIIASVLLIVGNHMASGSTVLGWTRTKFWMNGLFFLVSGYGIASLAILAQRKDGATGGEPEWAN